MSRPNKKFPAHSSLFYAFAAQRFWRVVNWAPLNRTWFVSEVQFFKSRHDKEPLPTNNPASAIASSTYLSFPAPQAFDGNRDTAWLPDGWWERIAGGDWIGYDFPAPVDINSVRIISDYNDTSDVSAKILVEAGPTAFGPFQTRWMSVNSERNPDMRFNNPSKNRNKVLILFSLLIRVETKDSFHSG
jgi:hypothetical protein